MSDVEYIDDQTEIEDPDGEDKILGIDEEQTDLSLKTILIKIKNLFVNGLYLLAGRLFAREMETSGFSGSGWVTIGVLAAGTSFRCAAATFWAYFLQSYIKFEVSEDTRGTGDTQTIKIIDYNPGNTGNVITSARLVYDKSNSGQGAKVQIYLDNSSSGLLTTGFAHSSSGSSGWGWNLVTPIQETTPSTPGSTTASFLEAGTVYAVPWGDTRYMPNVDIFKSGDDQLRVTMVWVDIPKFDASDMTITLPSSAIRIYGPDETVYELDGTETITSVSTDVKTRIISFNINGTGIASTLPVNVNCSMRVAGAGAIFTLS